MAIIAHTYNIPSDWSFHILHKHPSTYGQQSPTHISSCNSSTGSITQNNHIRYQVSSDQSLQAPPNLTCDGGV